ncbi:MAG: DUF177 domain-containing protein [Pseudomonadales bacterium]|nr:DUF177 domain-containing protein [Pseudomonadales bacterium]
MQQERLPKTVNPARLAQRRIVMRGELPLSDLDRLCEQLVGSDGVVELELEFGEDEQGHTTIAGSASTKVELICQRCMDKMLHSVTANINLALVADDDAVNELPDRYEPIMADRSGFLSLRCLIEDDLILALPIVGYHDENCGFVDEDAEKEQDIEVSVENPFSVLEILKH